MSTAFVQSNAPLLTRRTMTAAQSGSLAKSQTRILHAVHANYAPQLAEALRELAPVQSVILFSIEESTPALLAARHGVPEHTLSFAAAQPDAGRLEFYGGLAGAMLDHLLNYRGAVNERRQMSDIETQLLGKTIEPLVDVYASCWRGQAELPIRFQERTVELKAGEPLFVATYHITLAEGSAQLVVVLRLSACADVLGAVAPPPQEIPTMSFRNLGLLGAIGDTMLSARALLGNTRISIAEFLDLRVGDVICLDQDAGAAVEIRVGNQAKLLGEARIQSGKYLVTVSQSAAKGGE